MQIKHFNTPAGDVLVANMVEEFPDFANLPDPLQVPTSFCIDPTPDFKTPLSKFEVHEHSLICGPIPNLVRGLHKLRINIGKWSFEQEFNLA